jgi:hypothetical protein
VSSHSRLNRPDIGIFTREDFERAWQRDPPPHQRASSGTAIHVYRNSLDDIQDQQIQLSIDDTPVGKIEYGQVFTRGVEPGLHTVRAFNLLFAETLTVDVCANEHVRVQCGRGVERPRWLKRLFPFLARRRVWLARH